MKFIVETINDLEKGESLTVKALNNLTNGEVIKTLFPSAKIIKENDCIGIERKQDSTLWFDIIWWNDLYKGV